MQFRFILIIILTLAISSIKAQKSKIDSLETILSTLELTDTKRIEVLNELCWQNRDIDPDKAMRYGLEARELSRKVGDVYSEAKSLNFTGVVYRNLGDFALATQDYFQALELSETHNLTEQLGYAYNNIGDIYKIQNQYDEAVEYTQKAVEVFRETNNLRGVAYGYIRMGEVYQETNQLDSALKLFIISLDIREKLGSDNQISSSLDRVGKAYQALGKYQKALEYYNRSLVISQKIENPRRVSDTKWSIGKTYMELGEYDSTILYTEEALKIAERLGAKDYIVNCSLTLSEIYAQLNNYEKAYEYRAKHADKNNELIDEELKRQVKGLKTQYELQKAHSELELKLKNEQINKIFIISLSTLVVLILVIVLILLKNRKQNVEVNKKLQLQNDELENLNHFRVKILAIITHDTRGPLHSIASILNLINKDAVSIDQIKVLFKQLEVKLGQVNMLLDNVLAWSRHNFDKALEKVHPIRASVRENIIKIVDLFSDSVQQKSIDVELAIAEEYVLVDKDMFNTILRNLIANAIKFTEKKGTIKIYTSSTDTRIKIHIEDDGMGISKERHSTLFTESVLSTKGSNQEIGTGLGLVLCKQYVELNKGVIGVESESGKGSTFWFELPKY